MARDTVKFVWRAPVELKKAAEACAESVHQSLNNYITMAVAQRTRRWRDPFTSKPLVATRKKAEPYLGWVCSHGACGGVNAEDCRGKKIPSHRTSWYNEELGRSDYDAWWLELTGEVTDDKG